MTFRLALLLAVTLTFTAFSCVVTWRNGYFGFLTMAWDNEWGMQVLLDLVIALLLLSRHMVGEARAAGIRAWPYLVGLPLLGSISALIFYLHVNWKTRHRAT